MVVVENEESALRALQTIVDQGEGSIGVPDSHYSIFVELYQERKNWVCIEFVKDPNTSLYKEYPLAYQVRIIPLSVHRHNCDICFIGRISFLYPSTPPFATSSKPSTDAGRRAILPSDNSSSAICIVS